MTWVNKALLILLACIYYKHLWCFRGKFFLCLCIFLGWNEIKHFIIIHPFHSFLFLWVKFLIFTHQGIGLLYLYYKHSLDKCYYMYLKDWLESLWCIVSIRWNQWHYSVIIEWTKLVLRWYMESKNWMYLKLIEKVVLTGW